MLCTSQMEASTFPLKRRAFEFLETFCPNPPPLTGPKSCSNVPHPRENYQITVLTFSSFHYASEAVYVNMVYWYPVISPPVISPSPKVTSPHTGSHFPHARLLCSIQKILLLNVCISFLSVLSESDNLFVPIWS